MDFVKLEKVHFLLILVLGILVIYVYSLSFINSSYSPYYGDEYFYFKNSEAFAESLSLKAPFTYSGHGSKILEMDAHGPAYPVLYGSISHIWGWNNQTIPIINLGILLITIGTLLFNQYIPYKNKALQVILILGSPFVLFYSISFLPELIQIAGAIGLFLLVNTYKKAPSKSSIAWLVFYILLLGLIRSTWFFAFFGLAFLPSSKGIAWKSLCLLAGIAMPFLMQQYFHEQVPNTFSGIGDLVSSGNFQEVWESLYFNTKRNIYFALHFTEGKFYSIQKIWIAFTIMVSSYYFKKDRIILFGLIIFIVQILFTIILYKNYDWAELRMLTPISIFLNLAILTSHKKIAYVLVCLNLLSFFLIFPFQRKILHLRTTHKTLAIPSQVMLEIKNLNEPLILLDSDLLQKYAIHQLPLITKSGSQARYILPYYEIPMKNPSHSLKIENGQIKVSRAKILTQ